MLIRVHNYNFLFYKMHLSNSHSKVAIFCWTSKCDKETTLTSIDLANSSN
jgi:hypothetical protein